MKFHWKDLWRWNGAEGRVQYLVLGAALFALKYLLDSVVAHFGFHHAWSPVGYLLPAQGALIKKLSPHDMRFYAVLLAMALPFVWSGSALTLRRLRSAQLPVWLLILFFFPIINLALFLLLIFAPERVTEEQALAETLGAHPTRIFRPAGPSHPLASAVISLVATTILGLGGVKLSVSALQIYGWGLFVGIPFALGFISIILFGYTGKRTYRSCVVVALMSNVVLGVALLAIDYEGLGCLVMATPLCLCIAWIGGLLAFKMLERRWRNRPHPWTVACLLLLVPALMGAEKAAQPPDAPIFCQQTSVIINAPPDVVWRHVISFPPLPPPQELLFKAGVSYPLRAEIQGRGEGAIRHCIFSTGTFVEPITTWDEPHLLKFSVTSTPPPMQEWSPYPNVDPPHLHDYLVSKAGQFRLIALSGNRTRLEGTTWYQHHLWPAGYWRLWSDPIIEAIHCRVLNHIKALCEDDRETPRHA